MIELEVAWCFPSGVEASHILQLSTTAALGFHFEDGDGLMTTVGHYHKTSRFMNANSTASIHGSWECARDGFDRLDQSKGGTSFESGHIFPVFGRCMDFIEKCAIDFKHGNLIGKGGKGRW